GSQLLFASEVRTLLGTGLVPARIGSAGLLNFLTYGSAYDPLTLIDGIYALPPGHALTWEAGTTFQRPYWDLMDDPAARSGFSVDAGNIRDQLCEKLEEAVRMQLVSDVPVGVFLSGGIDSSALVSILAGCGVTPSTFSIVFREADFSEA